MTVPHEPEVLAGRRAFPEAQRLLDGPTLRSADDLRNAGWHGTLTHPEAGAFAVVRRDLEDYVGEVIRVTYGSRSCVVYVVAARDVPQELSLTRRAFMALSPLWRERIRVQAEVVE